MTFFVPSEQFNKEKYTLILGTVFASYWGKAFTALFFFMQIWRWFHSSGINPFGNTKILLVSSLAYSTNTVEKEGLCYFNFFPLELF